ncbi:GIN domain-containing protein [Flavobacterium oreochromis]|uniref:DUF2807 domain-containing protein n=2 Tax=Flavobacterium TaxID=237 RepID=A0A246GCB6_9FLAO|nr:DUF2807 domain-containing protein [Flavobacterium oreochromis]OWP76290.1 DUF2807 domain-containing protein [Flavobacterium oreochromis]OWP78655.1 DUF2807 domain-containing protein [Flavobacterium oreochromis]POR26538.1 DUF2807 domain-containing protein [Flavobacterium columnare]QYS85645.1 DUF2807 domain-containing protein [Flavobacterium oreochromis]
MKKISLLFICLITSTLAFSQNKERIKGTKMVKTEKYETETFEEIEIEDNLEVYLIKAEKNAIEIEADDNLHEAIDRKIYGKTLRLNTNKEITTYKKIDVRIFYTDSLKLISVKHHSKLNAFNDLNVKKLTIKALDYSKTSVNATIPNFTLISNDKSKIELNLKGNNAVIEMSKNADLKALINTNSVKIDMYQKSSAAIEGDTNELKLRLDNNTKYEGKNLTSKNTTLTVEGYTDCDISTNGKLAISASGKSKLAIYGEPKIEIIKFADEAILMKKTK